MVADKMSVPLISVSWTRTSSNVLFNNSPDRTTWVPRVKGQSQEKLAKR